MEYIAFKAHKTRGPEIIKILESWGGVNIKGLDATGETRESVKIVYYVTHYNTIGYNPLSLVKSLGYKIYTLEEYEAMNKEKKYQEGYAQGYEDAVKTEMMYKEKEKQELLLGLVSVANKGQELIPHKDYEIKQDGEKFYLVKKKKKFPKTYEECCKVVRYNPHRIDDMGETICGYKSKLLRVFQMLLVCRDAYWKIAGEEMELGKPWEPDWYGGSLYLFYYNPQRDEFVKAHYSLGGSANSAFVFPTTEMRDAYMENFDPDIEKCKELI